MRDFCRWCGTPIGRAEILCLAPSLDAQEQGHPAIWNKLLSHLIHEAGSLAVNRIYAEAPDQPLLVNTFAAVGFQPYCRQTIWRCFEPGAARARCVAIQKSQGCTPAIDDWDLFDFMRRNGAGTGADCRGGDGRNREL